MYYKFPQGATVIIKKSVTAEDFASIHIPPDYLSHLRKQKLIAVPHIATWGSGNPRSNTPSYKVHDNSGYGGQSTWTMPEAFLELCETHAYKYEFTLVVVVEASTAEQSREYIAGAVEDMIDDEAGILPYGKIKRTRGK